MRATEFTRENTEKPPSKAKLWVEKVNGMFPRSPLGGPNQRAMAWGEGDDMQFAMFELSPMLGRGDRVEVKWFQAYPLRQGVGSKAMKVLTDLAQQDGITLSLAAWNHGAISPAALVKFYKKQGFKPVAKGSKNMTWEPTR